VIRRAALRRAALRAAVLSGCGPQALHVGSNRIGEPGDLERLSGLGGLLELSLAGNPLSRKNTYRTMVLAKAQRLHVLDAQVRGCHEAT
jgi:hypothetical protein